MYTRKKYSFKDMLMWTRLEIAVFVLLAAVTAVLFEVVGLKWLQLPWTPLALVGTAVAFLIGFQNNAAYGRSWEARQIWGGIVNSSRSWAISARDMVGNRHALLPLSEEELEEIRRTLIHRHIAWLTALRHAMRQKRPWEVFTESRTNKEWYEKVFIPERDCTLESEIGSLLSANE